MPRLSLLAVLTPLAVGTPSALAQRANTESPAPPPPPPVEVHRPPGPPPERFELPALATHPDGVFNRVQRQWRDRRNRMAQLRIDIQERGERVEPLRRSHRPEDNEALGRELAEMHRAVEALRREREETFAFLAQQVRPQLPDMLAELDDEIAALPEGGDAQEALLRVRGHLARWNESSSPVPMGFEGDWDGRGPRENIGEDLREGDERAAHWAVSRLIRLQEQQLRLERHLQRIGEEIRDLREMIEALPDEALESLPEEPPARERWPGRRGRDRD